MKRSAGPGVIYWKLQVPITTKHPDRQIDNLMASHSNLICPALSYSIGMLAKDEVFVAL